MLHLLLLAGSLAGVEIDEITVVARRRDSLRTVPLAVSAISPETSVGAVHPNQLFDAAPGTWVSRGSGQEHLTAIRSPVLTGAGACGAFLYLDDGIPIRPPGLCNVNNLFEFNLAQAAAVEILRGPAPALYGSNGLHGVINVRAPVPDADAPPQVSLWLGPDDYRRLAGSVSAAAGSGALRLAADGSSSDSFRVGESVDQQKLNLAWQGELAGAVAGVSLAAVNLNQETAGFIFGADAYRDPLLRRGNVNPEAYRDAHALRLSGSLALDRGGWAHVVRPFARSSRMAFLQHFLPGKPLEENGQDSLGLQWLASTEAGHQEIRVGADLDIADGFLREFQAGPTEGSAFLQGTRPPGLHYDYTVKVATVAVFGELDRQLAQDWTAHLGLRAERSGYRYDNLALDGNTRDDGTACGFGGCLYTRPADRRDSFVDVAPKLGLSRRGENSLFYGRLSRGFRAPQATELYRLQRGQATADLNSEKVLNTELGWRWFGPQSTFQVAAYYLGKRNFIFRDADGLNVSDGQTRHRGLEWQAAVDLGRGLRLDSSGAYARQNYAFTRNAGGGEVIVSGNAIDTAPRWLARTALTFSGNHMQTSVEWIHQGDYFLDAANAHSYPGHNLLHLAWRRSWRDWQLNLRLDNLSNRRYAERADFAFGNFRYFPGAGRQLFAGISWRPGGY